MMGDERMNVISLLQVLFSEKVTTIHLLIRDSKWKRNFIWATHTHTHTTRNLSGKFKLFSSLNFHWTCSKSINQVMVSFSLSLVVTFVSQARKREREREKKVISLPHTHAETWENRRIKKVASPSYFSSTWSHARLLFLWRWLRDQIGFTFKKERELSQTAALSIWHTHSKS